jgi:hypothetical protein
LVNLVFLTPPSAEKNIRTSRVLTLAQEQGHSVKTIEIQDDNLASIPLPDHLALRLLEGYFAPEPLHRWARTLLQATTEGDAILLTEGDFLQARFAQDYGRRVLLVPTPRDADGLPQSLLTESLSPAMRQKARVLPYLLQTGQDLLDSAMPETQTQRPGVIVSWLTTLLESNQPTVTADYIALIDPHTLTTPEEIEEKHGVLLTIALRLDAQTRLVDTNAIFRA